MEMAKRYPEEFHLAKIVPSNPKQSRGFWCSQSQRPSHNVPSARRGINFSIFIPLARNSIEYFLCRSVYLTLLQIIRNKSFARFGGCVCVCAYTTKPHRFMQSDGLHPKLLKQLAESLRAVKGSSD